MMQRLDEQTTCLIGGDGQGDGPKALCLCLHVLPCSRCDVPHPLCGLPSPRTVRVYHAWRVLGNRPRFIRVRPTMVRRGLALKDHGRARTLKGQHGRPVCGQTTRIASAQTF